MSIYSNTGVGIFIHLTDQAIILQNFKNDNFKNLIKASLRFTVAFIVLGLLAKIGFYLNLVIGFAKSIISVTSINKDSNLLKESKDHFMKAIIDLAVCIFRQFSIIIYTISPEMMKKILKGIPNQRKLY
jgi:hypothetical protein